MAKSPELDRARKLYSNVLASLPTDRAPGIEDLRTAFQGLYDNFDLPSDAQIEEVDANGVRALWVTAPGAGGDTTIVHLHGGGYCLGSADGYRPLAYDLSRATGARVLVVDYRLSPEHAFPDPVDDVVAAYKYAIATGNPPEKTVVTGDSAGGGLTLSLALSVRNAGDPAPAGLVLLSPLADLAGESESLTSRADRDPIVDAGLISNLGGAFLGGRDPKQTPLASPLADDLANLPPALILVGTDEALFDDATRVTDKIKAAGGDAELVIGEDMIHVWPLFASFLPEGKQAIEQIARFVARTTA